MCGIAGILSSGAEAAALLPALMAMADSMRARGPDDEGYLVGFMDGRKPRIFAGDDTPKTAAVGPFQPSDHARDAGDGLQGHLFLGHRRLSILDLSPAGHQPMVSHDGRYWIVFNGEIYNFREIAAELGTAGVQFLGHSDTEVVLAAYRRWGAAALERFNGMFALAIWDDAEKALFCARDRLGIKPFYYVSDNRRFVFASDIKALLASGLHPARVDEEGLYHCLSFGVAPRPMTAFQGVRALRPGHWMRIDRDGGTETHCFWRLPAGSQDCDMSPSAAVALLRDKLEASVRRRLVADVPVGTFMSGGVDSTCVSALASRNHPGIKAFTLAFEEEAGDLDEVAQARATAAMYPMEHIVETVRSDDMLEHLPEMIRCYEEPFYALSPNYVISRVAAQHGVTVVLNGLGGDELFAGYSWYLWPGRWRTLRWFRWLAPMLVGAGGRIEKLRGLLGTRSADRLHTTIFAAQSDRAKRRLMRLARPVRDTVELVRELYLPADLEFFDDIEALSYMDVVNYIGNHHLYRVDQFTMHFSLEGRFPLLDHELVEAAFRIPSRLKIRDGVQKWVLREVARDLVHPSCLSMGKKGFRLPVERWMRGPLRPLVEESLNAIKQRGLFVPEVVEERYRGFQAGRVPYTQIWQLVATELWYREFIDGKGAG